MKRFICEGELVPKGYGISYREVHRMGAICYPIPLNLVIAIWHHFYAWLLVSCAFWRTRQDVICDACFAKGRDSADKLVEFKLKAIYDSLSKMSDRDREGRG